MQIKLIFHPPVGPMGGIMQILDETQTGLIPNVNDLVNMGGKHNRITKKSFHFHGTDHVEIDFATEEVK